MNSVGGHSRISQQRSVKNKKNRALRVRNRGIRERALIDAAAKLFADQGYEHTTTRQIAAKAECAEGLISRYFQGKAGLLRKLVELQLSRTPTVSTPPAPTLREEVQRLMEEEVQRMWEDRAFLKMIVPQMILDSNLGRELQEISDGRARIIVERLRTHKESSLSQDELTALATSIIGLGSVFGFWRPIALGQSLDQAKQMALTMATVLSRAF